MRRQQREFEKAKVFSITRRGKGHYFTHTGLLKPISLHTEKGEFKKTNENYHQIVDEKFQEWELERWLKSKAWALTQRMFHTTIRTFDQTY